MRRISALAVALAVASSACSLVGTDPAGARFSGLATMEEAQLLTGVRVDLQDTCQPRRGASPGGAIAEIECRPTSDLASHVAVSLFDSEDALMGAYLGMLAERQIQPRTDGAPCAPGQATESAYTPGDSGPDLLPVRGACFFDPDGVAHYLATLPPYVLVEVDGVDPEAVERFAWLGNQDVPGSPTIWSGSGPKSPEK